MQTHGEHGLKNTRFLGAADLEISRYLSPQLSTLSLNYSRVAQCILSQLETQRLTKSPTPLHREPAHYIRRDSSVSAA